MGKENFDRLDIPSEGENASLTEELERAKAQKLEAIKMPDSPRKEGMLKALNGIIQDIEKEIAEKGVVKTEEDESDPFSRAMESAHGRVLRREDNYKDTGRA